MVRSSGAMEEPASNRRRRRWLIAAVALVVVAVLGGVALWVIDRLRTDTTPVSFEQAAAEFEEPRPSTAESPATGSSSVVTASVPTTVTPTSASPSSSSVLPATTAVDRAVAALPEPGVYRFATAGGESLAILNNPSRTYPAETPVIIEPQGCGVVVRWTPLEERTETWEMCLQDGGARLAGYTSVHEFFDQREERVFVCEPGAWLIPPPGVGDVTTATCSGSGLTEVRETRALGRPTVTIGGESIEAVEIATVVTTTGATVGTTTRRLTLAAEDAFPLVWVDEVANTTSTAVGDASYRETVRLEAVSQQPG